MTLASGRFAMIDNGLGFQLVPWRPALEKELGREVRGVMAPGGNVEWSSGPEAGARTMRITTPSIRLLRQRVRVPDASRSALAAASRDAADLVSL